MIYSLRSQSTLAWISVSLLIAISVMAVITRAAQAITVAPPLIEETVSAGETLSKTITVTNDANVTETYEVDIQNFVPTGELGGSEITETKTDIATWITPGFESISVDAGKSVELSLSINVPSDATAGGHYAAVVVGTAPTVAPEGAGIAPGVATAVKVTSLILLNVTGQIRESGTVVEFSTEQGSYKPLVPIPFTVRFQNTGNTHVKPQGFIEIFRGSDKIDELEVNETGGLALPNSTRRFDVTWNKGVGFGKYTAKLTLSYGSGLTATAPDISFWVINWTTVVVVIVVIIVIIVLAAVLSRRPAAPAPGKK